MKKMLLLPALALCLGFSDEAGQGVHWSIRDAAKGELTCSDVDAATVEWVFEQTRDNEGAGRVEKAALSFLFPCAPQADQVVLPAGSYVATARLLAPDGAILATCAPALSQPFSAAANHIDPCQFEFTFAGPAERHEGPKSPLQTVEGLPDIALGHGYWQESVRAPAPMPATPSRLAEDACVKGLVETSLKPEDASSTSVTHVLQQLEPQEELTEFPFFAPVPTDISAVLPGDVLQLLGAAETAALTAWARSTERSRVFVAATMIHAQTFRLRDEVWSGEPGDDCGSGYVRGINAGSSGVSVIKVVFPDAASARSFERDHGQIPLTLQIGEPNYDEQTQALAQAGAEVYSRTYHIGGDKERLTAIVGEGICQTLDLAACVKQRAAFLDAVVQDANEAPLSLGDLGNWVRTSWIIGDNAPLLLAMD